MSEKQVRDRQTMRAQQEIDLLLLPQQARESRERLKRCVAALELMLAALRTA